MLNFDVLMITISRIDKKQRSQKCRIWEQAILVRQGKFEKGQLQIKVSIRQDRTSISMT